MSYRQLGFQEGRDELQFRRRENSPARVGAGRHRCRRLAQRRLQEGALPRRRGRRGRCSTDGLLSLDLETVRRTNQDRESAAVLRSNSRYLFNPAVPAGVAPARLARCQRSSPTRRRSTSSRPSSARDDPYGSKVTMGKDTYSFYQSYTADLEYVQKIGDQLVYQLQANFAIDDFEILRSIGGDLEPLANGTVSFRFGNFANYRNSYNFDNKFTLPLRARPTPAHGLLRPGIPARDQDTPGWFDTVGRFQDGRYGAFAVWNPRDRSRCATPRRNAPPAPRRGTSSAAAMRIVARLLCRVAFRILRRPAAHPRRRALQRLFTRQLLRSHRDQSRDRHAHVPTRRRRSTVPSCKFTPQLSGFAMYSESLEPQLGADADGRALDPVNRQGLRYRPEIRAARRPAFRHGVVFRVKRENIASRDSAREVATARQPFFIYGDAEESQGIEVDLSYNPHAALAGHLRLRARDQGRDRHLDDARARRPAAGGVSEGRLSPLDQVRLSHRPLNGFVLRRRPA